MKYTTEEINFLIKNYESDEKDFILANVNHTWHSIKEKCKKLKLSRPKFRSNKLKKLLDNTPLNLYIYGLILSDGYISEKGNLKIHLHNKDFNYLNNISNYLNCELFNSKQMCCLELMDTINGVKLLNMKMVISMQLTL